MFWAVVIGLFNYIPYVGSIIGVALPVVLSLAQFGSFGTTAVLAGLLMAAQTWVGNILEPRMIGRQLNLSPFVVLVALSVWSALWGLPGAILAIPMTSMLVIICGADSDSLKGLPGSELELYQLATAAAARKLVNQDAAKDLISALAIANQMARRREISTIEAGACLTKTPELQTLWNTLVKEEKPLPLLKLVAAKSAKQAAQYEFVHLSIQEGLFAADLLRNVNTWVGWCDDVSAAKFLNEQFNQNVCRIGSTTLGEALAKRRASWHFEKEMNSGLTAVGDLLDDPFCQSNAAAFCQDACSPWQ
jgi:hypothetical protein